VNQCDDIVGDLKPGDMITFVIGVSQKSGREQAEAALRAKGVGVLPR